MIPAEYSRVIRKALERYRNRLQEIDMMDWYKDRSVVANEVAIIDAALAWLDAQQQPATATECWQPLEDGVHVFTENEGIIIRGDKLEATVRPLKTRYDSLGRAYTAVLMWESVEVTLPPDYRLFRRTGTGEREAGQDG